MKLLGQVLAGALRQLADEVEARSDTLDGVTYRVAGDEQGGANPSPAFATDSWPRETQIETGSESFVGEPLPAPAGRTMTAGRDVLCDGQFGARRHQRVPAPKPDCLSQGARHRRPRALWLWKAGVDAQ